MKYRTMRFIGGEENVSLLGLGCMRFPLKEDGTIDEFQAEEMIERAINAGINYIDTAYPYHKGESEPFLGRALKKYPRNSFYLATKLPVWLVNSVEDAERLFKEQLSRLQTKYIDYYLLHALDAGRWEKLVKEGIIQWAEEKKASGQIRHLGFSFHGTVDTYDYALSLHDEVKWDFVQIQLNYVDWKHSSGRNVNADYLYDELVKRNIPAIIMEPLLGGRLSNVPTHIMTRLKQRRPEDSVASWAFRFAGSPELVLTVLSGMTYMEHLQDNIRTYSPLIPLTDDDKEFLEETAQLMLKYPTVPCNDCKYCMPCPYGIDIPAVLIHYNKCVNEGNVPKSQQDENYRKARQAFLVGYDRSVPRLRQANHCIGCDQCSPHCPQSINIPRELRRIDGFVEQLKQGTL